MLEVEVTQKKAIGIRNVWLLFWRVTLGGARAGRLGVGLFDMPVTLDDLEALVRRRLDAVIAEERRAAREVGSAAEKRVKTLRRRLWRAGYEYNIDYLLELTSLLNTRTPFLNREVHEVRERKEYRSRVRNGEQPRIASRFETNLYLADLMVRNSEASGGRDGVKDLNCGRRTEWTFAGETSFAMGDSGRAST